jgi:hypothetical protein
MHLIGSGLRSRATRLPEAPSKGDTMMRSLAFVLAAAGLTLTLPAAALSVDELVDKNVAARGGRDRLQAITSLRRSGKLLVNGGQLELQLVETRKRPAFIRNDASLQGLTLVQAYDGRDGWQINPFQGRKDPERMAADDTKGLAEDADIDGPLVDWKAKHYQLDYLGTEDVDGTEAHKLKLTRPNGDLEYVYLDPDHFLEIRTLSDRVVHGVHEETQTDYGDYEPVNGPQGPVYFPLQIETGLKASSDKQKIQFDQAEANLSADEALFRMPATARK